MRTIVKFSLIAMLVYEPGPSIDTGHDRNLDKADESARSADAFMRHRSKA